MANVAVLSGPERRRRWTSAEKLRIVEESLAGEASVAEIARRHDIHPNVLHLWRRQVRTGVQSPRVEAGTPPDGAIQFAAVSVAPEQRLLAATLPVAPGGVIEIEFGTWARLRITGPVDMVTLSAAIAAMARGGRR
jgi:transposase